MLFDWEYDPEAGACVSTDRPDGNAFYATHAVLPPGLSVDYGVSDWHRCFGGTTASPPRLSDEPLLDRGSD